MKVPTAIANENEIKRNAVNLVETSIELTFFTTHSQNYIVYFDHLQRCKCQ